MTDQQKPVLVPLNDDEFIRKHSAKHRRRCRHIREILQGLDVFREYADETSKRWGPRSVSSDGLESWISTTGDYSMGRVVIDGAPPDLVADAVTANELRLTFDENLRGHTRVTEFEDIAGNLMGGYDYTHYRKGTYVCECVCPGMCGVCSCLLYTSPSPRDRG